MKKYSEKNVIYKFYKLQNIKISHQNSSKSNMPVKIYICI